MAGSMFLLRSVFWLGVVAFVVPYSAIDMANATFTIDSASLLKQVDQLPHYCQGNRKACVKALVMIEQMGKDGTRALNSARTHFARKDLNPSHSD